MKRGSCLLFIGLIFCLNLYVISAAKNDLVNKQVSRSIDLSSQLATHSIDIVIENSGETTDYYLLAIQPEFSSKLSYIQVSRGSSETEAGERKVLETKKVDSTAVDYALFSTQLGQKLEKGKTDNLHVELVFTHTMVPYPHEITQSERQLVKYTDNHYWYSVYKTESVKTKLKLSSASVQHYRELQPFSVKGDIVTYGPYKDIPPLSHSLLSLHFENNSPFITINRLQRSVEISNWGNIAFEEQYKISHDGAKLKGTFSRYDFQINAQAHGQVAAVQILDINVPGTAWDVYYRDDIGNISTSALRPTKPKQKLELRPRFPMFGGWKTEFIVGYNVPTSTYLGYEYSSGKYVLKVPFVPDWEYGVAITDHVLKVILPEGSSGISVKAPFPVTIKTEDYLFTYLDSKRFGRPVVLIEGTNLANIHNQIIEISYHFNSLFIFWEPILLIGSYAIIFLSIIACLRLDLSIEEVKTSLVDQSILFIYEDIAEKRDELHDKMNEQFSKFLKDSDSKTYETEKKNILGHFLGFKKQVNEKFEEIKTKFPDVAARLLDLEKKQAEKEKVQQQALEFQLKYKLKKTTGISQDAYETEKANFKEKYDTLSEDIESDLEQLKEKFYY